MLICIINILILKVFFSTSIQQFYVETFKEKIFWENIIISIFQTIKQITKNLCISYGDLVLTKIHYLKIYTVKSPNILERVNSTSERMFSILLKSLSNLKMNLIF